jgi:hypothetical protein
MKYIAMILIFALTACVGVPVSPFVGPGGVVVAVDSTGVTLNHDGYVIWTGEGVPASYFTVTAQGYHLTDAMWHAGNKIREARLNPAPSFPATGASAKAVPIK